MLSPVGSAGEAEHVEGAPPEMEGVAFVMAVPFTKVMGLAL